MMVAAHAFDILGAQACSFKAAYVNRYRLPTEDSDYQPDIIVDDFVKLAERLVVTQVELSSFAVGAAGTGLRRQGIDHLGQVLEAVDSVRQTGRHRRSLLMVW